MTDEIRGLSLTQPWASLVALGHKRVETRSWSTNYRGLVAIHAAQKYPADARLFAAEERQRRRIPYGQLPLGAIVCVSEIMDVLPTAGAGPLLSTLERRLGDYTPGRFAWVLAPPLALVEPIKCRGALGLWRLTPHVAEHVAQAREAALLARGAAP